MTYGTSQRRAESRASQPRSRAATKIRPAARGGSAVGTRLVHLSAPGLSLPKTGRAAEAAGPGSVSEAKLAFTVKLSHSLIQRVRQYAKTQGLSISEVVSRALLGLLAGRRGRG